MGIFDRAKDSDSLASGVPASSEPTADPSEGVDAEGPSHEFGGEPGDPFAEGSDISARPDSSGPQGTA